MTQGERNVTDAEPAAAAAVAGVAEARRRGVLGRDASVLVLNTGNGLKDLDGAMQALGRPHRVGVDFAEVARIVESEGGGPP